MSEKKLNILMVSNNYKPYSGGLVSALDSYIDSLQKLGCKVNLVTLDFTGNNNDPKYIHRVYCPIKFNYKKNFIAVPFFAKRFLKKIIEKESPDIIHIHHPFLLGPIALKIAKKKKIPVIFTHHTLYENYLHNVPLPQFITRPLTNLFVKNFCKMVNHIIVPSNSIKNLVINSDISNSINVISTGINKIYLNNELYKKTDAEKFKLLTVSRFSKEKNIYFLLDVFKELDQNKFCFKLIGFGPEFENLKNYAYKILNLSDQNIQFLEKPAKEEILKNYKEADLFIFASQTETQGLVLAEAMASGTPVVALNGPAINDIVINDYNGFVCEDKKEMTMQITKIAQDKILHQNLQNNAWKTGEEYQPDKCAEQLINCYKKVLNT
ncbi:glycosyltransferase [Candidatus Dependentiae bacterium]|nr:glycosyltransferase [Candidatus Dependentiae bacterium]